MSPSHTILATARERLPGVAPTLAYLAVGLGLALVPDLGITWSDARPAEPPVCGVVAVLLLAGLHLGRARRPVAVVAASVIVLLGEALLSGGTSLGGILLACDLVHHLVIARATPRAARVLPGVAGGCLAVATAGLVLADALPTVLVQATALLLALGVTLWWALSVRGPMTAAARAREQALLQAREIEARHREALVEERLQISRELHDAVSGHLAGIAMQSAAVLAEREPQTADLREALARVRALSLDAMGDMRALVEVLRADPGQAPALTRRWPEVVRLIDDARAAGRTIVVRGRLDDAEDLEPAASAAAYAVVREGLANAARHAPGAAIDLEIERTTTTVAIGLCNRLPALPGAWPPGSGGHGLVGLAERLRLCGGHLESGPVAGGWRLRADLPCREVSRA